MLLALCGTALAAEPLGVMTAAITAQRDAEAYAVSRTLLRELARGQVGDPCTMYIVQGASVQTTSSPKTNFSDVVIVPRIENERNLVDPARGDRYWSSIKPCESRALGARHTAQ